MVDVLPEIVTVVFLIFCLIDCIQTDTALVRNLPKVAWIILIIILPLIGGVAWLVAGRPQRSASSTAIPWRSTPNAGFPEHERPPAVRATEEIDEQLRRDQERVDREFEEALRKERERVKENQESLRRWEEDLQERERRLQQRPDDDPPAS